MNRATHEPVDYNRKAEIWWWISVVGPGRVKNRIVFNDHHPVGVFEVLSV
jgi:hypothetical protein